MIEPKDLRIGNLLDFEGTIFEVTEIGGQGVRLKNSEEETWIDLFQMSPIPLTPEWLIRGGFEKGIHYHKNDCRLYIRQYKMFELWIDFYGEKEMKLVDLSYVHEWQNAHRVLTGKELEFKI